MMDITSSTANTADVADRAPVAPDRDTDRNVYDVLVERGFVAQVSDDAGLRAALERPVTVYCGYDPTATSLHIGHQLTLMVLAHFQRHGHRPITLIGGGTGMIGDPTDRGSQRPLLTEGQIEQNIAAMQPQFARFLDFNQDFNQEEAGSAARGEAGSAAFARREWGAGERRALLLDNADWLLGLGYIEFLRDIGKHFSVNQLLSHSTYRDRLEGGSLNFIEINYVLLQAYDFLHQYREFGCTVQIGGGDQWFNVLAGSDLIRRVEGGQAFAMVTPLLTTASGEKMGKTTSGAAGIWIDPKQTSPYDYYQYWINIEDAAVEQRLKLYTFLPLDEIATLMQLEGADLRLAKEVLAFEVTRIAHGEAEARKAQAEAHLLFQSRASGAAWTLVEREAPTAAHALGSVIARAGTVNIGITPAPAEALVTAADASVGGEVIPTTAVPRATLEAGVALVDLLVTARLAQSKGEARRLIAQGGAYVNGESATAPDQIVTAAHLTDGTILLRAGKKRYARIVVA